MTLQEFAQVITTLGIPAVYGYYNDENPQKPPYLAYRSNEKNVIHADGIVVYAEEWCALEFISRYRDLTMERLIENLLTGYGIAFDSPECYFDEKQKIHITAYSFMLE